MKRIIILLFIPGAFVSCSSNPEDKDKESPTIDLYTPQDLQGYTGSQAIVISGLVKDNKYIKEIHIEITNQVTAQEYLHVHIHPTSATSNFNQSFNVQAGIQYSIRVVAEDGSSNSAAKKVQIACN